MTDQLVIFTLDNEAYALPITQVQEIIRYHAPRTIPASGYGVLGVINLRSKIIPVCDVRSLLGRAASDPTPQDASVVILDTSAGAIGLVVDSVSEVTSINPDEIDTTTNSSGAMSGIVRVADALVILLDIEALAAMLAPQPLAQAA